MTILIRYLQVTWYDYNTIDDTYMYLYKKKVVSTERCASLFYRDKYSDKILSPLWLLTFDLSNERKDSKDTRQQCLGGFKWQVFSRKNRCRHTFNIHCLIWHLYIYIWKLPYKNIKQHQTVVKFTPMYDAIFLSLLYKYFSMEWFSCDY